MTDNITPIKTLEGIHRSPRRWRLCGRQSKVK